MADEFISTEDAAVYCGVSMSFLNKRRAEDESGCNIRLDVPNVSDVHCVIILQADMSFSVRDLRSRLPSCFRAAKRYRHKGKRLVGRRLLFE